MNAAIANWSTKPQVSSVSLNYAQSESTSDKTGPWRYGTRVSTRPDPPLGSSRD
jgi:hypothetical protein